MEAPLYTSKEVQAAKKQFKSRKRKIQLSFRQLFNYFKRDSLRFQEIARISGVSRQEVHHLYDKFFRPLFGDESGQNRRMKHTLRKAAEKIKQHEAKSLSQGVIGIIVKSAHAHGCHVVGVPIKKEKASCEIKVSRLRINGHLCSIKHMTSPFSLHRESRLYTRTTISPSVLRETEFTIFLVSVKGLLSHIFVVPNSLLLAVHFTLPQVTLKQVVISLERVPVYHNRPPKIQYWDYENAWHLLRKESL